MCPSVHPIRTQYPSRIPHQAAVHLYRRGNSRNCLCPAGPPPKAYQINDFLKLVFSKARLHVILIWKVAMCRKSKLQLELKSFTLTVGFKGGVKVPSRSPSQLKPSNHLQFKIIKILNKQYDFMTNTYRLHILMNTHTCVSGCP